MCALPPSRFQERMICLLFNFDKFARITASVYPESLFSFYESLGVFWYYFAKYEDLTYTKHPPIKSEQIVRLCLEMPGFENAYGQHTKLYPENYIPMIDKHFVTNYRKCDYNINHFFSGRVRELRYLETH